MRTPRRNGVPADRPRHFCDGGGADRIASLVPRGAGGPSPGIGTVPHGRPDRPGANGAFCLSGTSRSLRARHPALCPSPPWLSPQPLLRPRSTLLSPSSASRPPSPPCCCPSPASERLLPEPAPCAQSPALSWLSSALRACALAGRKRAFACGVPGALRGTWVSSTRFDEMNDPCPRNVLI